MNVVDLHHITKTFEGREVSLRGTTLEAKAPALWLRNVSLALRLTGSTAPPVTVLRAVPLTLAPGTVRCVCPHRMVGDVQMIRARESGVL